MKTLLFFKRFDLVLQLCSLFGSALLALSAWQYFSVLYLYFAVGGAQVASFLIHALAGKQTWMLVDRTQYGKLLAVLAVVAAVALLGSRIDDDFTMAGLVVGVAYLIGTPVIAVLYFLTCLRETARVGRAVRRERLIVRSV